MNRRNATGDGDVCPVNPSHGEMLRYPSWSGQWCPHQSHDVDRTPALYATDGVTPLRRSDQRSNSVVPVDAEAEWDDLLAPVVAPEPIDAARAKREHRAELRRRRKARALGLTEGEYEPGPG